MHDGCSLSFFTSHTHIHMKTCRDNNNNSSHPLTWLSVKSCWCCCWCSFKFRKACVSGKLEPRKSFVCKYGMWHDVENFKVYGRIKGWYVDDILHFTLSATETLLKIYWGLRTSAHELRIFLKNFNGFLELWIYQNKIQFWT